MKILLKWGIGLGLLGAAAGGCAARGPGLNDGSQQNLLTAWNTGSCPQSDTDGGSWVRQVGSANVGPIPWVSPGQHTTELPITVNRFVLCQYDSASGRRTGAVVVTARAIVARLTADLSDVIATNGTSCPGTQHVVMLAGEGQHVVTVNVLTGQCDQVIGPQVAEYQGDALPNDLAAALSSRP